MKNKHPQDPLAHAQKYAMLGGFVYLILALSKLLGSYLLTSATLRADGFNNLADIISSVTVLGGLWLARRPADSNHHFGHQRYETLSSLIVSFIMFYIGMQVTTEGLRQAFSRHYPPADPQVMWIALGSSILLLLAYQQIYSAAKRTESIGLAATATDMRNDILMTLLAVLGPIGAWLNLPQLDTWIAIGIGGLIIYSAYKVFRRASFDLSDGFDYKLLTQYKEAILQHPDVFGVPNIRGRRHGQLIYLDIIIEVDGNLSVFQAHLITEQIEEMLIQQHQVYDCDIHVEPFEIIQ